MPCVEPANGQARMLSTPSYVLLRGRREDLRALTTGGFIVVADPPGTAPGSYTIITKGTDLRV